MSRHRPSSAKPTARYAHRRFGEASGTPLIFLQHFRGGLDHWDPLVTDGLAAGRPVILFDNAGVASSSGETPDTRRWASTPPPSSRPWALTLRQPDLDVIYQHKRGLKAPR